jgi:hypothetical protein
MDATQFSALCAAVRDGPAGVSLDGFEAGYDPDEGTYRFVAPDVERSSLDESAFREVAAAHDVYVTNWYFWTAVAPEEDARHDYLRWLEGANEYGVARRYDLLADGHTRTWGQFRVTVTLAGDGTRRYELRHEDDADADVETLETHDKPRSARQLAKHDDRGRYRPLKTAPTLQSGWVFPDLGPAALVETVDFLYPATIANWHREREGELDVTHWDENTERQTGIYGLLETWNRQEGHEHVNRVAEACCVDSRCLKRREWEYSEDEDLDVPGGEGEFPCREPCSLVHAAARQWTKLEGEQPRTYEFELTPSEKEQLEAIIDAVAEGRTDEIREADVYDAANRYRVRYTRAKLFDDDGNLCGVPTDPDE